jgi:pimeloyl-ACP methyl ester carboxylesterase
LQVGDPVLLRDDGGPDVVGTLRDEGRGSGVVVVPGILCTRRLRGIDDLADALSAEHDTLCIDVRGHGDAPGKFSWGREEWRQVRVAAGYLARGGRRVTAVGFSFGGYHSAKAASQGAPLDRLVLVCAPVDLAVHDHFPFGGDFWRTLPAILRRPRAFPRFERPRGLAERALSHGELSAITARTLVIHSGRDWLITRRHAERYAGEIPEASLVEIADGLHAEYLMDSNRDELVGSILEFCR